MTNTPTTISRTITIASVASLIMIAGLTGCSKSDDAKAAVNDANRTFSSIAAGDSTASVTFTETAYKEIENSVSKYAGSENSYAEAAAISLSLAKLGQASMASQDAAKAEIASLHKGRIIRGIINEWLIMSAIAQAAGQFDASDEFAEIKNLITIRQEDVTQYTAQRNEIDSRIADLDAQIAELRTKSADERNTSGGLELQMARVSATRAAEIVVRVREHTLRADGYALEAVRIEGVVGQLRPGAREISLNVEKAKSQIKLLDESNTELLARQAANQEDAQQAQTAATAATKRIKTAVGDFTQHRSSEVESANETAISLTRASIAALRDANKATKQVASLSKSSAQQTLAECYARQAAGYAEAAILYNWLAEAGIPGDWAALAQTAANNQVQTKQDSDEAYQSAASSLRGARVKGAEADRIEATAVRLDLLGGVEPEPEYEETYDDDTDDMDYEDEEFTDDEPVEDEPIEDPDG